MNFQKLKLDLEKAEEIEIKLATSAESSKKQESSRKSIYFCFIDYAKVLTAWITTTLHASWETCMQVRKQQLELDIEQQTGSK